MFKTPTLQFCSILCLILLHFYIHKGCRLQLKRDTWVQFSQHFSRSFYAHKSQKHKKGWQLDCIFCTFGICQCKSCVRTCWWIWPLGSISPKIFPKAQKDTDDVTVYLRFWDLWAQKLRVNMLVKLIPNYEVLNFFNVS